MDKLSYRNQLLERDNIFKNSHDLIRSILKDHYNEIENEDFKKEFTDSLKNSIKKLADVDNLNNLKKEITCQILDENFDNINSIDKRYEELINLSQSNKEQHEIITSFNDLLEDLSKTEKETIEGNNEEEELILMSDNVDVYCPITKKKMRNPYKNINCGHNYEYENIMHLLAHNNKTKCPVAGCKSQKKIKPKDLTPNLDLKNKLNST